MKTVIFGITGGIAAYKMEETIPLILSENIFAEVIVTDAAAALIAVPTIEKLIGKKVYSSLFHHVIDVKQIVTKRKVEHIELADSASCIVIAPATANILAKLAHGIADDYLTTVVLAATCPIVIFPSMNVHMWEHPATQENVRTLRKLGYTVFEPDEGMLACGYEGKGKLPKPEHIAGEVKKIIFKRESLQGKKIIVTAGATQEAIDDVRFITNHASGKMGAAIADALFLRGAEVIFVHGKNSVLPQYTVRKIPFETANDLEEILQLEVSYANVLFHTAAVSDFSVKKMIGKISSDKEVILLLIPREKILSKIKTWNPNIFLIGFKAGAKISEEELIDKAKKRMKESQADCFVANEVGKEDRGFGADTNEMFIVQKNGNVIHVPLASKREVAERIIDSTLLEDSI